MKEECIQLKPENLVGVSKQERNNVEICEGSRVKISGLRSRPDLNGQDGTAKTLDATSGRWVVQVRNH